MLLALRSSRGSGSEGSGNASPVLQSAHSSPRSVEPVATRNDVMNFLKSCHRKKIREECDQRLVVLREKHKQLLELSNDPPNSKSSEQELEHIGNQVVKQTKVYVENLRQAYSKLRALDSLDLDAVITKAIEDTGKTDESESEDEGMGYAEECEDVDEVEESDEDEVDADKRAEKRKRSVIERPQTRSFTHNKRPRYRKSKGLPFCEEEIEVAREWLKARRNAIVHNQIVQSKAFDKFLKGGPIVKGYPVRTSGGLVKYFKRNGEWPSPCKGCLICTPNPPSTPEGSASESDSETDGEDYSSE